jgi:hypothetical protein
VNIAAPVLAAAIVLSTVVRAGSQPAPATQTAPPPVAATVDSGLAAVRDGMLKAVEARSFDGLEPYLAPKVAWMFKSDSREAFIRRAKAWRAREADAFWTSVREALSTGLVLGDHDDAWAPYVPKDQSSLGFRIRFVKVAGGWKASAFAAGD